MYDPCRAARVELVSNLEHARRQLVVRMFRVREDPRFCGNDERAKTLVTDQAVWRHGDARVNLHLTLGHVSAALRGTRRQLPTLDLFATRMIFRDPVDVEVALLARGTNFHAEGDTDLRVVLGLLNIVDGFLQI